MPRSAHELDSNFSCEFAAPRVSDLLGAILRDRLTTLRGPYAFTEVASECVVRRPHGMHGEEKVVGRIRVRNNMKQRVAIVQPRCQLVNRRTYEFGPTIPQGPEVAR